VNVDTADLTELARQVAVLTGRVSALTGRVTVLGNQVTAAGERVEQATTAAAILRNAGVHDAEYEQMLARARGARKGRHARPRHLKVVE
jgi:hypothetical protein